MTALKICMKNLRCMEKKAGKQSSPGQGIVFPLEQLHIFLVLNPLVQSKRHFR